MADTTEYLINIDQGISLTDTSFRMDMFYVGSVPQNRINITNTDKAIIHFSLQIDSCNKPTGLKFINQDTVQSHENFSFDSTQIEIQIYDTTIFENTLDVSPCDSNILWISDFTKKVYPGTWYPGTTTNEWLMKIQGIGFGATKGNIYFPNADDGGQTYVPLNKRDFLWSNNLIQIRMPSVIDSFPIGVNPNDYTHPPPGGGVFYVKTSAGDSLFSTSSIQPPVSMPYAIHNYIWSTPYMKHRVNLADFNHHGGYTFRLDTSITHYPDTNLIPAIKQAVLNWVCATRVNFVVDADNDTTLNNASDYVSVIYFVNHLDDSALMATYLQTSFNTNYTDTVFLLHDMDIAILRNPPNYSWYIDVAGNTNLPPDSLDFIGALQHELGHACLLEHVTDIVELMYFGVSPGPVSASQRKEITDGDKDGGISVVNRSSEPGIYYGSAYGPLIPVQLNKSVDCTSGIPELKPVGFNMIVYPNPVSDNQLNIVYEITQNSKISFTVIDIMGKLIFSANEKQAAGRHEKKITLENMAPGIYFLVAKVNGATRSFKLVKIH
ncbi:MAG: T9SS type A sorting domain-containing protein [Bacteroidia bacterium]|nr:T9SS type A sorting domain-containing protein [Bacteroidia bacterium]